MLRYNKYGSRIFLAPEGASGGGGSVGNPAANQGGASVSAGSDTTATNPFAGMDLDDLDPAARAVVEKAQASFASLQKQLADEAAARAVEEKQKREFQSKFDQLQVQVSKLSGAPQVDTQDQAKAQHLERFTKILVNRGVPEPQAKMQADLMLEMMTDFGDTLKGEIGRDLAPFAGSVVQREAESSWNFALQTDKVGALQIPEVANETWAQIQGLVQEGRKVTPELVKNLSGIAYLRHLEKGGSTAEPQVSPTPQLPNFGRATYPGAGAAAVRPPVHDPRAPKTTLDPATDAALQAVMGKWDVKPKSYRNGK